MTWLFDTMIENRFFSQKSSASSLRPMTCHTQSSDSLHQGFGGCRQPPAHDPADLMVEARAALTRRVRETAYNVSVGSPSGQSRVIMSFS